MPQARHGVTFHWAVGLSTTRGCGTQRGPGRSQPAAGLVERMVRRLVSGATRAVVMGRRRIAVLPALLRPWRAGSAEAQTVDLAIEGPQRRQSHGSRHHASYNPACREVGACLLGGAR